MAFLLLPSCDLNIVRLAIGAAGPHGRPETGHTVVRRNPQTMYSIISFMSPNSITVLSSIITMRP
jgi:hypothetical protein